MTAVRRLLDRSVDALQQGFLAALPHGGQRTARANAWAEVELGWTRGDDRAPAATATRRIEDVELPAYAACGR